KPIVVDQRRVAVLAQQQVTAEASTQADGIDEEVGEVNQVHVICQSQVVRLRLGIQVLPETKPALAPLQGIDHQHNLLRSSSPPASVRTRAIARAVARMSILTIGCSLRESSIVSDQSPLTVGSSTGRRTTARSWPSVATTR